MMPSVVTSFSPAGAIEYGWFFVESFDQHWPREIDLIVYVEEETPAPPSRSGRHIEMRRLDQLVSLKMFLHRFGSNPLYCGRQPTDIWKSKDRLDGYSFRTDASKFCRKVFAVRNAADQDHHQGVMAWCDADVRCLARPPGDFLDRLIGPNACAFLGREGTHSECGFLIFRLPDALDIIRRWSAMYQYGGFINEREWHDSYLFDIVCTGAVVRNLTPGGKRHVWVDSPLNPYLDHLKGERKKLGYSPERMAKVQR